MTQPNVAPVRIAIISTPRVGNTWVRTLLARLYNVPQIAAHSMKEEDWERLPPHCLFQMHAHHTPQLRERLQHLGFRIVSLARHPLDVLISILHFAVFESEIARWLEGEGGTEKSILLVPPSSPEFADYSCGPRAKVLLGLTPEWWDQPGCINLRYEDLVTDPHSRLEWLVNQIGLPPQGDTIEQAIEACSMDTMRKVSANNHYWKGRPGTWRLFLTADIARRIAVTHQSVFTLLGYDCQPDPDLTADQANSTWRGLIQEEWWPYIVKNQRKREELLSHIETLHRNIAVETETLQRARDELMSIHRGVGQRTLAIGLGVARALHATLGWAGGLFKPRKAA